MKEAADTPTFYFFNLGCAKNLVDAQRTAERLLAYGYREAPNPEEADLLVITTCAFIEPAERESVDEILRVATARADHQILAVLGCLVSRENTAELEELLPEVDIFLKVPDMEKLPEELSKRGLLSPGRPASRSRKLFTPAHLAYLKIADGCGNCCSYCLIPSIRGDLRSLPEKDIVAEAQDLVSLGVRELVVIAQDTASWGRDLKQGKGLDYLLTSIREKADPDWLRVMYLHPAHIDPDLMIGLINDEIILPYLDIPIQHVSGRILKSMGRGYDKSCLENLFGRLRDEVPGLVLRTTVMAGYPAETEEEFEQLCDFLEEFEFDYAGVFGYCPEEGTRAFKISGRVDEDTVRNRVERISDLQMEISQSRLTARVGERERVLVDRVIGESEDLITAEGRFYGQCYEVDGMVLLSGGRPGPGSFREVEFDSIQIYDLYGRLIN
ncbi:MAG: 30S ribosomal protein S12 methylthiotransferase RimO [Candidatus Latescibacteria bacterium]|nr:30S ribosomal protein S12 methylthiotransferase RimO [bacterium]MBD3424818.1 30S ribosomal protein S12 methylthiotransferase RimO [Candidatus Latescibacterota bacterium]